VAGGLRADLAVQVLAATHSPLVLASLEPVFEEGKDRLFWFDLEDDKVFFRPYAWAVQGSVANWLTSDIFGLKQARSREAEQAIEAAEAYMGNQAEGMPEHLQTRQAIHRELLRLLPGDDPLWPRWLAKTKAVSSV
jgi:hypothetical protein